ncbi:histidinol dehydrogenase [Bernardetia sp.]|uniref:histidinol dehydrogenase n=1 Tax=Bernardetia sp. TaxID=1937974 RepID=UPI0025C35A9D|nr:histidinol dehydrogenase [Bernardetia sp.]
MKIYNQPARNEWESICTRPTFSLKQIESQVQSVLQAIKTDGDTAITKFTKEFDKIELQNFRVGAKELEEAEKNVSEALKKAINQAYQNILAFHQSQKEEIKKIEVTKGITCWRKSVGIEKVGLYIPGGTAPLFSTVLMLGIPAKIAGCKNIVLCSPPNKEGKIHPAILYAAHLVGVTDIFKIGGIQAIGAMAYGTESVPKVYKIFGPGNQYVTVAKQLIQNEGIAIDMPAGPSEVAVLADRTCEPSFVAADLLSQAEHGKDSQVLLVTDNTETANQIKTEVEKQLESLPRKEFAQKSLENSRFVVLKNRQEILDLSNFYAPEHLIIALENPEEAAEHIINAGSVFLGNYTPESVGDYASGTNHTLPTDGHARAYSGVSLDSFVKKITFQSLTKEGLGQIGQTVIEMAEAEELKAHANAVRVRL